MRTSSSRFLTRVMCFLWRPEYDSITTIIEVYKARGYSNSFTREYLLQQKSLWGDVAHERIMEGIIVGVADYYYEIVAEWSNYPTKMDKLFLSCEPYIFLSSKADINELLTHPSEVVRAKAKARIEVKGVDALYE